MINNHLKIAINASLEAGEAIMKIYNTPFDVELKEDNSPLTEADKEANKIINAHLLTTKIPIISEESKQTAYQIRKNWTSCWVVDPVDGTKEFVKRNGEFTVNIALVSNQKPILGVIYVPATKVLYIADTIKAIALKATLESHRTSINEVLELLQPLHPTSIDSNLVRVVGSRSHMSPETADYIETLKSKGKTVEIVSKGSSLKFCLLAEGQADVYPRFAPTMEWDTAAGQAICNAVGIDVISQQTNEPLLYNKEKLLNPWFLVSKK